METAFSVSSVAAFVRTSGSDAPYRSSAHTWTMSCPADARWAGRESLDGLISTVPSGGGDTSGASGPPGAAVSTRTPTRTSDRSREHGRGPATGHREVPVVDAEPVVRSVRSEVPHCRPHPAVRRSSALCPPTTAARTPGRTGAIDVPAVGPDCEGMLRSAVPRRSVLLRRSYLGSVGGAADGSVTSCVTGGPPTLRTWT